MELFKALQKLQTTATNLQRRQLALAVARHGRMRDNPTSSSGWQTLASSLQHEGRLSVRRAGTAAAGRTI